MYPLYSIFWQNQNFCCCFLAKEATRRGEGERGKGAPAFFRVCPEIFSLAQRLRAKIGERWQPCGQTELKSHVRNQRFRLLRASSLMDGHPSDFVAVDREINERGT